MLGGALLLVVVAIAVALARLILLHAGEPRWSIACALGVMLNVGASILLARLTGSTVLGTLIFAALAGIGLAALRRRPLSVEPLEVPAQPSRVALAFAGLALFLVSWAAIQGYWWDESFLHFQLASVCSRGVIPPVHPLYPIEPLRYHYGYDFLAGQIRAFSGIPIAHALDVVTIACFILLLATSAAIGGALAGARGAGLAMTLLPFGTGLLRYFLLRMNGPMDIFWDALPKSWFEPLPPPQISNFFQHPVGLGMPIALAVLILFDGSEATVRQRRMRMGIGAILLGLLSIAQVAYFSMVGLVLGVAVLWRVLRERSAKGAAIELAMLAGAVPIAFALGGVLTPGGHTEKMLILGRSFFPDPIGLRILRYLVLFGVPLLALPFAFRELRRRPSFLRVALFSGAVAGYLLPNFVVYARSWDIVKFYGIATLFASALLADLSARVRPIVAAVLAILTTLTSWLFLVRMSVMDGRLGTPPMHFGRHPSVDDLVADRLGPLVPPGDRVFTVMEWTAWAGGFLTPGFRWQQYGEGYMMDRRALDALAHAHARARRDLAIEDLEALDVRWAVLRPFDIEVMSERGRKSLEDPARFEHLFDVEDRGEVRRVYRIIRLTSRSGAALGGPR
jgi:hypothetical protein